MIRKNERVVSFLLIMLGIFLTFSSQTFAVRHLMIINEFSTGFNGDTSVQYIELLTIAPFQNFTAGAAIIARNGDGSSETVVFTFPINFGSGQAGDHILIATPNFEGLSGIAPDFLFNGGLSPGSGQIMLFPSPIEVSDALSYGDYSGTPAPGAVGVAQALPGDSTLALARKANTGNDSLDYGLFENSPVNFNLEAGHMGPLPVCDLNPILIGTNLSLNFSLGPDQPVTWSVLLFFQGGSAPLWSVPLPPIDPPVALPISIPVFPQIGTVAFVSVFSTLEVNCLDVEVVFTGTPAAMPTAGELEELFREHRP